MRRHFAGEQRHRLLDHGMVHDPALIEVANEFVHSVFTPQRPNPLDAIIGIAKDPHLSVQILVLYVLDTGEDLTECLKALDVGFAERPQPFQDQDTKLAGETSDSIRREDFGWAV